MKKKVVSVLLAAAMTTTLVAGCGSTGAEDTAADTSAEETTESTDDTEADAADAEETANAGATYKVAVVKQMDHASLDEIANAVEEELDAIAAKNGVTIEYETYSGQGDQSTLTQIGTQAVADGVDAIIPIATLAAQVMGNLCRGYPDTGCLCSHLRSGSSRDDWHRLCNRYFRRIEYHLYHGYDAGTEPRCTEGWSSLFPV